jgi:hypothetical protein
MGVYETATPFFPRLWEHGMRGSADDRTNGRRRQRATGPVAGIEWCRRTTGRTMVYQPLTEMLDGLFGKWNDPLGPGPDDDAPSRKVYVFNPQARDFFREDPVRQQIQNGLVALREHLGVKKPFVQAFYARRQPMDLGPRRR